MLRKQVWLGLTIIYNLDFTSFTDFETTQLDFCMTFFLTERAGQRPDWYNGSVL